jgi:hypothetical protein
LTAEEFEALERSLLAEGCRDALVLWGDMLVDGHNRYGICRKHGLPFQTVQNTRFQSLADVQLSMIDQHLGGGAASRSSSVACSPCASGGDRCRSTSPRRHAQSGGGRSGRTGACRRSRPCRARSARYPRSCKAARLSSNQVVLIEKIQKQAAPEVVAAVKAGTISINAAAAVESLPAEEQVAAAAAGKDELKQAASACVNPSESLAMSPPPRRSRGPPNPRTLWSRCESVLPP